jgi:Methyltransferase domain
VAEPDLCSREYRDVLLQTHKASGMKWGGAGKSHAETVKAFAYQLQAVTVLDYGCGRGTLKEAVPFQVQEYDPGIPGKDALPEPADLVVCTDVLEHIEPDKLDNVLRHLRSLTKKGIFLVIALTPARQILSDGRNAHISLHPSKWWLRKLQDAGFEIRDLTLKKGMWIWAIPRRNVVFRWLKPFQVKR